MSFILVYHLISFIRSYCYFAHKEISIRNLVISSHLIFFLIVPCTRCEQRDILCQKYFTKNVKFRLLSCYKLCFEESNKLLAWKFFRIILFFYLYMIPMQEDVAPKKCNLCTSDWISKLWQKEEETSGLGPSWRYPWMRVLKDWRLFAVGKTKAGKDSKSHRGKRVSLVCSLSI